MKRYIQTAIYQLRNQPLLSAITILGTALTICLIMVILIIYQAKTADYVPEVNRSRSLYVKWVRYLVDKEKNWASHSRASLWLAKEVFYNLKTPEAVTAYYLAGDVQVGVTGLADEEVTSLLLTDAAFWKVYQFRFLAGKPYSEAEHQSGIKSAVVAERVARRLYGSAEVAIGKTVSINFADYTICGVVEDVNKFCELSYAEVWAPYNSNGVATGSHESGNGQCTGNYNIVMLAKSSADFDDIRAEVDKGVNSVNTMLAPHNSELQLMGQPDDFKTQLARIYANQYDNLKGDFYKYLIMIGIILLVPAINLSGLTNTRMRRRLEELGLRKAFGATSNSLMWQVLNENLVLTVIGGICGLALAYAAIWLLGDWLLQTTDSAVASMNVAMISPVVFFIAFAFCLLLNMLSAYLPAWRVAHMPIITSLNQKL